jgi:hypothetical protein
VQRDTEGESERGGREKGRIRRERESEESKSHACKHAYTYAHTRVRTHTKNAKGDTMDNSRWNREPQRINVGLNDPFLFPLTSPRRRREPPPLRPVRRIKIISLGATASGKVRGKKR